MQLMKRVLRIIDRRHRFGVSSQTLVFRKPRNVRRWTPPAMKLVGPEQRSHYLLHSSVTWLSHRTTRMD